jgi:hypothetical protein
MSPRLLVAALAALAVAPAAQAQRPAGGEVHPTKATYSPTQPIDVSWSGFATGEVYFWMEPRGTPLKGFAHGSYHSDYEESGHYALENPGPGKWEIHWTVLGEDGVYQGGPFTVRPTRVRRVSRGHYGCYTTTTLGLTRSSLQFIEIKGAHRYKALGRVGKFRYNRRTATLKMTSGPLKRRVARFRAEKKPKTIVFLRRANETKRGKPTIDVSDTYCYRGEK